MSHSVFIKSFQAVLLATAVLATSNASADIVISGTRIIYPQSSKDVVVNLDNHGTKPLLVQTWLDDGRDGVNPEELKLPFIITLSVRGLSCPANFWRRSSGRSAEVKRRWPALQRSFCRIRISWCLMNLRTIWICPCCSGWRNI